LLVLNLELGGFSFLQTKENKWSYLGSPQVREDYNLSHFDKTFLCAFKNSLQPLMFIFEDLFETHTYFPLSIFPFITHESHVLGVLPLVPFAHEYFAS